MTVPERGVTRSNPIRWSDDDRIEDRFLKASEVKLRLHPMTAGSHDNVVKQGLLLFPHVPQKAL